MTSRLVVVAAFLLCEPIPAGRAAAPPAVLTDLYGDPLPRGAVARLGSVRWRSPDGPGSSRYTRAEHFAFLPDGKHLAAVSNPCPRDGRPSLASLSLFDMRTGRLKRTLRAGKSDLGSTDGFECFAFTPDGKHMAYSAQVGLGGIGRPSWWSAILLVEVDTGKVVAEAPNEDANAIQLAVSPDAKFVAFSNRTGSLFLWDVAANTLTTLSKGHMFDATHHLGFSADGKRLVLVNTELLQIDIATGKVRLRIPVHRVGPSACAVAPGGRFAAVHNKSDEMDLHDLENGTKRTLPLEEKERYVDLSFSPDARTLLVRDREAERVAFWNVAEGRLRRRLHVPGLKAAPYVVRLSPDGRTLAGFEARSVPRLWDAATGQPRARFPGPAKPPIRIAFSQDGKEVVALSSHTWEHGTDDAYRWEAATGKPLRHTILKLPPKGEGDTEDDWQLSPDGDAFTVRSERRLGLLDTRTGRCLTAAAGRAKYVGQAFSPNGHLLAVARDDRVVEVRDANSDRLLRQVRLGQATKKIDWVGFSSGGKALLTGESSGEVWLWDTVTGKYLKSFRRPREVELDRGSAPDWRPILSCDGRTLALWKGWDLYLWDLQAGRVIGPLKNPDGVAGQEAHIGTPTAFSPDGRLLACLEYERLCLFEVATGRVVHRLDGRFETAAFSPDGRRLATSCSADASVLVWDVRSLPPAKRP